MKKTRLLILLSIMACLILSLSACNRTSLDTPVGLSVDEAVAKLSWQGDSGAVSYTIEVNQYISGKWEFYKEGTSDTNSYKISDLPTNINYQFKVKAIGDGKSYSDSRWSDPIECFKPYENGLYFQGINGDTEYSLMGIGSALPVNGVIEIPSMYRGKKVTEIGNRALFKQTTISEVIIPDTVKVIGKEAFRDCKMLEKVVLPNSVTTMGSYTFFGCSALKSVKISDNLETIPTNCFGRCIRLGDIDFGAGVKHIESYAFQGCWSNLTSKNEATGEMETTASGIINLNLPDSIETIDNGAFSQCKNLLSVVCGANLKTIGPQVFADDDSLETVTFNDRLDLIGNRAFHRCLGLKEIDLPDSLTVIGVSAFSDCGALDVVNIGSGLTNIGEYAFANTKLFADSLARGEDVIYIGEENGDKWLVGANVVIDEDENGDAYINKGVHGTDNYYLEVKEGTVGIAEGALSYVYSEYKKDTEEYRFVFSKLDRVKIPNSVRYINGGAFRLCINLSEVEIGNGVEEIGMAAFEMCNNLRKVDIPNDSRLRTIGAYAFSCGARGVSGPMKDQLGIESKLGQPLGSEGGLEDMNLPATLESIGAYAFYKTYFFKYYTSVVYVGGWAVGISSEADANLAVINIEEIPATSPSQKPIVGISDYAFAAVGTATEVIIPKSVKRIGLGAFSKAEALTSVTIPEGVTTINESTFYKCDALLTVNLPKSLRTIKSLAFYECGLGKNTELPQGAAMTISGLENVSSIGDFAFYGCNRLKHAGLGNNLTELGAKAFTGCTALQSVSIPDSLTEIKEFTFSNCSGLQNVVIGKGVEKIGRYAFRGTGISVLNIPGNVKSIGESAFRACDSLIALNIESGVEEIGNYAFYGCEFLGNNELGATYAVNIPETVTSIGDYAFRNCVSLNSIILTDSIKSMGMHVFNKCDKLVVYTNMAELPAEWSKKWNSSYRPVLYGCKLSSDGTYVESFVKNDDTIDNYFARYEELSAPERAGYIFANWKASDGTTYTASELKNVPNGTELTASWGN